MVYHIGDFAFYNGEFVEVTRVAAGHVTEVKTWAISTGGRALEEDMVPLSRDAAGFSAWRATCYERLSKECSHFNFPDINRHLNALWLKGCQEMNAGKQEDANATYEEIRNFTEEVLKVARMRNAAVVGGVRIFRGP